MAHVLVKSLEEAWLDQQLEKARTRGAKDKAPRKHRGMTLEEHKKAAYQHSKVYKRRGI